MLLLKLGLVMTCFMQTVLYAEGSDSDCTLALGECQDDYIYCVGQYISGVCSGPTNRRCCLPRGTACGDLYIISRSEWGASAPRRSSYIRTPVQKFIVHHTDTDFCFFRAACAQEVRRIQRIHQWHKGWYDIGYNFLVGEDGFVYEGRGWSKIGSHTLGHNSRSFGAAMIGNFKNRIPVPQAITAMKNLLACGVQLGKISYSYELLGHRDKGSTECPGDALYNEIQTWEYCCYIR